MRNLREILPKRVKGLSWFKVYILAGDLHFPINDNKGTERTLVVKDAVFDATGYINLIATADLNTMNWDVNFSMHPLRSGLFLYEATKSLAIARVPLRVVGKLRTLPVTDDQHSTCFHASCGTMSLEELMHERMAHVSILKLASMSTQVSGLPRPLHCTKVLRLPCTLCYAAKAKRQNYPDASTTLAENEDDLLTWDLID
eukprot:2919680-Rhodomonas_salina.1